MFFTSRNTSILDLQRPNWCRWLHVAIRSDENALASEPHFLSHSLGKDPEAGKD